MFSCIYSEYQLQEMTGNDQKKELLKKLKNFCFIFEKDVDIKDKGMLI